MPLGLVATTRDLTQRCWVRPRCCSPHGHLDRSLAGYSGSSDTRHRRREPGRDRSATTQVTPLGVSSLVVSLVCFPLQGHVLFYQRLFSSAPCFFRVIWIGTITISPKRKKYHHDSSILKHVMAILPSFKICYSIRSGFLWEPGKARPG